MVYSFGRFPSRRNEVSHSLGYAFSSFFPFIFCITLDYLQTLTSVYSSSIYFHMRTHSHSIIFEDTKYLMWQNTIYAATERERNIHIWYSYKQQWQPFLFAIYFNFKICSEKWRKLFSLSFGSFECVYLLYAIERARDNLYLLSTRFHYYHFVPFPAAFSPYECIILRNTLSHTHIWMKYSRTQYVLNARIFNEIRCRRILFLVCRHEEQRRGRKKNNINLNGYIFSLTSTHERWMWRS